MVDDNEDNRLVFATVLAHAGYDVREAADGREAVNAARALSPDLVLLDIHMPVMSGWDAARALRADPRTAAIPVLAVSAADLSDDVDRLRNAGFCGFLGKPVLPSAMLRAIETCLLRWSAGDRWIDLAILQLRATAPPPAQR